MNIQTFYFWSQSIYAIVGIVLFIAIFVLLYGLVKKLTRLEEKLEIIAERGVATAESAKNIIEGGEKVVFWGIYKMLKKFGRFGDDC